MRRTLEIIGIAALAFMCWVTYGAVYGADRLPDRIATHFKLNGQPDGWGSPTILLLIPAIALANYAGLTIVARFPSMFNYPVRMTDENRARLQAVALNMIVWIKVESVSLFAWIEWAIIGAAREGRFRLPAVLAAVCFAAIFATIAWYIVAMFRTARPEAG
jgi:hypothetical protein